MKLSKKQKQRMAESVYFLLSMTILIIMFLFLTMGWAL